jgi:hypothetical protein
MYLYTGSMQSSSQSSSPRNVNDTLCNTGLPIKYSQKLNASGDNYVAGSHSLLVRVGLFLHGKDAAGLQMQFSY